MKNKFLKLNAFSGEFKTNEAPHLYLNSIYKEKSGNEFYLPLNDYICRSKIDFSLPHWKMLYQKIKCGDA